MACVWKPNWNETRQHFLDWWDHTGLLVGSWGAPPRVGPAHDPDAIQPPPPVSVEAGYTDVAQLVRRNHYRLSHGYFGADILPVADTDIGPGSLALLLGSEPGFAPNTVWYEPAFRDHPNPEELPPLRFDPRNRWWQVHEQTFRAQVALGRGKYFTGCPDLIENIDILSALRDPQTLMMDMLERPAWVRRAVGEINQAFFEAYDRTYEIIKDDDGSVFGPFRIWGPGRTVKVQCDACAMFSPAMFRDFVQPALTAQCDWLDHSLYHLDGTQCICHLDALLEIEPLDAIEWTPQAGIEGGGHPRWFPLYKRILDAGKSVQIMAGGVETIEPVFKAIGSRGVYLLCGFRSAAEVDDAARIADRWR